MFGVEQMFVSKRVDLIVSFLLPTSTHDSFGLSLILFTLFETKGRTLLFYPGFLELEPIG